MELLSRCVDLSLVRDGLGLLLQVWQQILVDGLVESRIQLSLLDPSNHYYVLQTYDTGNIYLGFSPLDPFLKYRPLEYCFVSCLHKDFL